MVPAAGRGERIPRGRPGAFGAHGLKAVLQRYETLDTWQTAVFYHALHTLVLLALSAVPGVSKGAVISFVFGIVVFSGSLYLLAVTNVRWLALSPRSAAWACWSAGRGCSSLQARKCRDSDRLVPRLA